MKLIFTVAEIVIKSWGPSVDQKDENNALNKIQRPWIWPLPNPEMASMFLELLN